MNKYKLWLTGLLALCLLYFPALFAATEQSQLGVKFAYEHNHLTLSNPTNHAINLQKARLRFYSRQAIDSLQAADNSNLPLSMQVTNPILPNNPGNIYNVDLSKLNNPLLAAHSSIMLTVNARQQAMMTGMRLTLAPEPVPVKIKLRKTRTGVNIQVCNTSKDPISLKNVEMDFKYNGQLKTVTGKPNLNWKLASQTGQNVVLTGGDAQAADLPADARCKSPLTVDITGQKANSRIIPPVVFKADKGGSPPTGTGSIMVTMPPAPADGLSDPTVTIKSDTVNQSQVVTWDNTWTLDNLAAGNYTVTASNVDNGETSYYANPVDVTVVENETANAMIEYQAVDANPVNVTLTDAPGPQEISFTGQTYTFTKTVDGSASLMLPADSYNISATAPGYDVSINPNPLNVPSDTELSITYTKTSTGGKLAFGGYFESWGSGRATDISNLPTYVSYVYLSFARPDSSYQKGSLNLSGTGLEFSYDGQSLKNAVAQLHQKQPNTKVILSVGGATYSNWGAFNATACANIVKDFGLDGIDIDYEAANPGCTKGSDGLIHCQIDTAFQNIIHSARVQLPKPYLITVAAWSISAYGEGKWANASPQGNFTGMMLPFFRSQYANDLDVVNVMSYDAGPTFKPTEALAAYSNYYKGTILMGVEVPPEGWGGHVYTMSEVNALAQAVKTTSATRSATTGMMIWSLQKQPNGTPSQSNPNAQMMATSICGIFGLSNCSSPIISLH